jgi:hypothetical protein
MKRSILASAVLYLCSTLSVQVASGATRSVYHENGLVEDAFFSSVDNSGCVETAVWFSTENASKTQSPPGPGDVWKGAIISISKFDYCSNTQLMNASGGVSSPDLDIQVESTLRSATVQLVIPVDDSISQTSFNVAVNLSFTATAATEHLNDITHTSTPGFNVSERLGGTYRPAVAVGVISDGITNFAPTASTWGRLFRVRIGSVYIEKK